MDFTLNPNDKLIWKKEAPLESLKELCSEISEDLKQTPAPFCLWLEGDLGAGKTTLTKELFYALGLDRSVPVGSPTYTYLLEYDVGNKIFAHMDLYRFSEGVPLEEDELLSRPNYDGFLLEWPNNVKLPDSMKATHKLHITHLDPEKRLYQFYKA